MLPADAPDDRLIRAAAANHVAWFSRTAKARGGTLHRDGGLRWTETPGGADGGGEAVFLFPRLRPDDAGALLDAALDACRSRGVPRASCWSLWPSRTLDLGARLLARGFEWGFSPHWMALATDTPLADRPPPNGVTVDADDAGGWDAADLPYDSRADDAVFARLARARPRRVWRFAARLADGRVAGHLALNVTAGTLGAGGVYNMGVAPDLRRRGIGRALVGAAAKVAAGEGCRHLLLNSAADDYYRALGFRSLGHGQTWWMHPPRLAGPPPDPMLVRFAETLGRDDQPSLDALRAAGATPDEVDAPLPCGLTSLALAARLNAPRAADWLLGRGGGATPEIVPLWDLGRRGHASYVLRARPDLASRPFGPWGITPAHEAVSRNDLDLLRLVLSAGPDLSIRDTHFDGTPHDWAFHIKRDEAAALLRAHEGEGGKV